LGYEYGAPAWDLGTTWGEVGVWRDFPWAVSLARNGSAYTIALSHQSTAEVYVYGGYRVSLSGIAPPAVRESGGDELTLTGAFALGIDYAVHFGPSGAADDPLCYGGRGWASTVQSADGVTLRCYLPPCAVGTGRARVVSPDGSYAVSAAVQVLDDRWSSKQRSLARAFAPWVETGERQP
jgi:hypothetical protein